MNPQSASTTPVARVVAILAAILSLPAVIVPFVSFTWETSPLDTIDAAFSGDPFWAFVLLGAPFLLGIPIVAVQISRIASLNIFRVWRTVGFALVACSAALNLTFVGMLGLDIFKMEGSDRLPVYLALFLVPAILAIGAILLWEIRRTSDKTGRMVVASAAAYLANASFCLIGFSDDPALGWWLALVASVGIALDAGQTATSMHRKPVG